MHVTRFRAENFGCLTEVDLRIPEGGVTFAGRNGSGKTTHLFGLRAALEGLGLSKDALREVIRDNSDVAILELDLGDVSVRRRISETSASLKVTRLVDGQRVEVRAAQTWLDQILGRVPLDPLQFFLSKPRERRERITKAIPWKVTVPQLREFVPEVPDRFDVSGNGFDVLERLATHVYEKRTAQNAAAKLARDEANRAAGAVPSPLPTSAGTVADVVAALERARGRVATLDAQDAAAREGAARTAGALGRAVELETEATRERAAAETVEPTYLDEEHTRKRVTAQRVVEARRALAEAEAADKKQGDRVAGLEAVHAAGLTRIARSNDLVRQAQDLRAGIAAASVAPVAPGQLAAARAEVSRLEAVRAEAEAAEKAAALKREAERLAALAEGAERKAATLDTYVRRLRDEAPARLMPSGAIPGLTTEGDEILIHGRPFDKLNGAEQIRFAVQLAKLAVVQAGGKIRLLVLEGLERIDPEQAATFMAEARSGGWQVWGTRVAAGQLVYEFPREEASADVAEAHHG